MQDISTKRAFNMKQKTIFHHFKGHSVVRNCLRPQSGSLILLINSGHYSLSY